MKRSCVVEKTDNNYNIIALLDENNRIIRLDLESPDDVRVGDIYVCRVKNVVKNINSAFVDFADGLKGYLPLKEQVRSSSLLSRKVKNVFDPVHKDPVAASKADQLPETGVKVVNEDLLLLQVSKEAHGLKAYFMTSELSISGRCLVIVKKHAPGFCAGISKKIRDREKREHLRELLSGWKLSLSDDKRADNGLHGSRPVSESVPDTPASENIPDNSIYGQVCAPFAFSFIIRTEAENASDEEITSEAARLYAEMREVLKKAQHASDGSLVYRGEGQVENYLKSYGQEMNLISNDSELLHELAARYYRTGICKYKRTDIIYDELSYDNADINDIGYEGSDLPANFHIWDSGTDGNIDAVYRISHTVEEALSRKVWLKSGGFLYIDQTEAMVVIDVNTGKAIKGKKPSEETFYRINLEAVSEIAYQLQLRNLSGIIVIDFIDMDPGHEEAVLIALKDAVKNDTEKCTVVDITGLGLVEMTRQKERMSFSESWRQKNNI